jgi:hypothetical protein
LQQRFLLIAFSQEAGFAFGMEFRIRPLLSADLL